MKIAFIRHGRTQGNIDKRYVGSVNSPVCEQGLAELRGLLTADIYPAAAHVYVSPMLRCLQTKDILYPNAPFTLVDGLREQHFGDLEGKTYAELEHDGAFRAWIASDGAGTPPNGEDMGAFAVRCDAALAFILGDAEEKNLDDIAVICHGGVMMGTFSRIAEPRRSFYDWLCGNGHGYIFASEHTASGGTGLKLIQRIDCEGAK